MAKHPPKKFRQTGAKRPHQPKSRISSIGTKVQPQSRQHTRTYDNPMQKAILNTLGYRQIFGCPMTLHQLWNYLLIDMETRGATLTNRLNPSATELKTTRRPPTNPNSLSNLKQLSTKQFVSILESLVTKGEIIYTNDLYSLEKIDYAGLGKRKKRAQELLVEANQIVRYLKQIPWIEMVAVTGSVAAFNADDQSDIDILVVTKPKRIFLSRLFLVSTLKLLGVYWNAKKPAGTICPNILMSSDNLTWHPKKQNLYTANEIALIYPIFSRHNCYFDFLNQNTWVKNYLPNINIPEIKPWTIKPTILGKLLDLVELASMKIQTRYMKNKMTTEIVSENFMHFNIHDSGPTILKKFKDLDN